MNTDGVAAAFELIIEEIEAVADEIASLGGDAFKTRDYEKAQVLGESGKSLLSFRSKVSELLEDWQAGIDLDTRRRFSPKPIEDKISEPRTHSKTSKTTLRVILPSGEVINEYFAADTFALTIKALGVERVRELRLVETGIPLIDSIKHPQYGQRKVNGWYICTNSSTKRKKDVLETLGKMLGLRLKVEITKAHR
ncbi:MAG: hypothetical protein NTV57_04700 [Cyanobacteria bacterium]|jgi:hypothetical protein|nr:hypothetical protein [Cyanobacteriota bacterium]